MNKTGLIAKISIKYVLPTCIWKYFWRIWRYFAFFCEFRGISRKYLNFAAPRLREISEALTNLGINYVLNLTHLVRTLNSLIGGKSLSKYTKWRTYCFTNMQKKVPTARNWPLPTNRWRTSQQNGLTESQSNN